MMFSLVYVLMDGWVNTREDGNLRRHHAHYDVTLMEFEIWYELSKTSCNHSSRVAIVKEINS